MPTLSKIIENSITQEPTLTSQTLWILLLYRKKYQALTNTFGIKTTATTPLWCPIKNRIKKNLKQRWTQTPSNPRLNEFERKTNWLGMLPTIISLGNSKRLNQNWKLCKSSLCTLTKSIMVLKKKNWPCNEVLEFLLVRSIKLGNRIKRIKAWELHWQN